MRLYVFECALRYVYCIIFIIIVSHQYNRIHINVFKSKSLFENRDFPIKILLVGIKQFIFHDHDFLVACIYKCDQEIEHNDNVENRVEEPNDPNQIDDDDQREAIEVVESVLET